ncbi:hypothetical protein KKE14_02505 [Patescibacteria group bacterium]|nr:hypothetical protein [Patescibacteria group bacterium]
MCFLALIASCSCSSNSPVVPLENDLKVVGDYSYSQRNGEIETGMLVMDIQHRIMLIPDNRSAASTFSNWWFDIQCEYRNYQYLFDDTPVYIRNTDVVIDITIDYKQNLPLNQPPFLFARGWIQHRNARDGSLLPGHSVQVGNLLLAPYGHMELTTKYWIPPGVPAEDPFTCITPWLSVQLVYNGGSFTMNLAGFTAGNWLLIAD